MGVYLVVFFRHAYGFMAAETFYLFYSKEHGAPDPESEATGRQSRRQRNDVATVA